MVFHGQAPGHEHEQERVEKRPDEHGDEHGDEQEYEPPPLPSLLFVITDRHRASEPLTSVLSEAVRGGARWLRVREPDLELFAYVSLCHALIESVSNAHVVWSVRPHAYAMLRTAYPELRLAVHLTGRDAEWTGAGESLLVGRSVHVAAGAVERVPPLASYLLLAPVFDTACKPDATPLGVAAIGDCVRRSTRHVVALGGVTVARVATCRDAGASAVAVCGGIMESDEPVVRVREYLDAWAQIVRPPR